MRSERESESYTPTKSWEVAREKRIQESDGILVFRLAQVYLHMVSVSDETKDHWQFVKVFMRYAKTIATWRAFPKKKKITYPYVSTHKQMDQYTSTNTLPYTHADLYILNINGYVSSI